VKHAALIFRRYKILSAMQGKTIQICLQNPEEVSRNREWQSSAANIPIRKDKDTKATAHAKKFPNKSHHLTAK
jgi:hypothetical protein